MRTLIISDMHLGARSGVDLLRRADIREPLIALVEDVDRVIVLGDGLELRESSLRAAITVAAPLFGELGRALGPEKEIIYLSGNHDHGVIAGWIDQRLETEAPGFLGLEHFITPQEINGAAVGLAECSAPAKLRFAYPGMWIRDDVYAFHGHYSDVHTTVPTFERLAAGLMARWAVDLPQNGATPDDYEAVLSPMYAWIHALARRSEHSLLSNGASASARAWVALAGEGRRQRPIRAAFLGLGLSGLVGMLNVTGFGPVESKLSGTALRQGSLRSLEEVLRRLEIDPPHVIYGHSHRAGPWPADDINEWTTASGTRMTNTGSWVYQPHFLDGLSGRSPYWPGTVVMVEETGPPQIIPLLTDFSQASLRPSQSRHAHQQVLA
jgi:predicted phosphodiesterase